MERGAQEAVPKVTAPKRNNFQVQFVLEKIFNKYIDKRFVKTTKIIELGTKFLEDGVLKIKPSEWESLKRKPRIEIFSKLLNDSSSVHYTFKTRDLCMTWVYGISPSDYEDFLKKEIEFVLRKLCDKKSSYRVSEKWCQDNNFTTENNPDVIETICKAMGVTDKNSLITNLKHELQQGTEEYWEFQEDWIAATLNDPEAITWNPILFDLCATKFNTAVSVIACMALPGNMVDIDECRIYPKRVEQADTSQVTFIRMNYEKYVYAVAEVAPVSLCGLLDALDKTLGSTETGLKEDREEIDRVSREVKEYLYQMKTRQCKLTSENEVLHDDLQKVEIRNNNLLEEKEKLLRQLKSKTQKQVNEVAALQKSVESLTEENEKFKQKNRKLTTQNTNLKSKLENHEKEIKEQKEKLEEQDRKIAQQDVRISKLERINSSSSSTRQKGVKKDSLVSVESVN